METIGAYEAKTHLPKSFEPVSKGERITITRLGVPVAVLLNRDSSSMKNVMTTSVRYGMIEKNKK